MGDHAVSARVASWKQPKWTLNGLSRKVSYKGAHDIKVKAGEPGVEKGQEQERFSSSQESIQNHPTKLIQANAHCCHSLHVWPHGLNGHHPGSKPWTSLLLCGTADPRNSAPQALLPLIDATVHCLWSIFS